MPRRIQLRRTKGWRKPPGAVVCSRPSKWGNPFRIDTGTELEAGIVYAVEIALLKYERHIKNEVKAGRLDLSELRGKDLCCWCKPGALCHVDVLLRLANSKGKEKART